MKLCLIVLVASLSCGCSAFEKACAAAMPVLSLGQSYGGDAAQAIEQAESYANNLPPAVQAKLGDALEAARKGLRVGQVALATASGACTALDPLDAFASFLTAWKAVREILASNGTLVGAAPGAVGGLPFDDPAIYRLAVSKGR